MTDDEDPALPADSKLTRTKQLWAQAGKFLTGRVARPEGERLPPGQHLVRDWPVLDLGLQPQVRREDWRLDVTGAVDNPVAWDFDGFITQPQATEVCDIHCVTTWSRYDNRFEGLPSRALADIVHPRPEASHVTLHGADGYTTNLALEDFLGEDVLLAHAWQGAPLTRDHGGPVRLVVPRLYFWKSAKWLNRIEFTTADRPGFWEVRGYHNRGDPWREERYSE
ncbi:sulfite oxidase-like oxidoreductase [Labrys monachus]|uniref:DMSO/TMAO reductase YedYZ molybdopterin-dependent catalytic subunit n=1 Tax=Labrys monachus TaxID=217067 RepID=A0ABU0FMK8_9HYPH|nr:sulfite oxidase-like oxidoreductase [Labrys monachus]MDQ0395843.1 DMSO/TMAO reductase YedYZ molybdopterin-dependent catalytic subunit [Labrys monachus]